MRLGGIASGMDTEKMVKELMNAEKVRVNKYYRQQESIKWKQEALNTTNKVLADFILKARSGFGLTSTSSTGSILNKGMDSFDWVKQANLSNENVLKATATNGAMEGRYDINVKNLASVASATSEDINGLLDNGRFKDPGEFTIQTAKGIATIKIEDASTGQIDISKVSSLEKALVISVNGNTVTLTNDMDTDAISSALSAFGTKLGNEGISMKNEGGVLSFTSKKDIVISSNDDASLSKLGMKAGIYEAKNTVYDVVKQINESVATDGKTSLGLRAAYDSKLGKLMITTKEQGKEQYISIKKGTNGTGNLDLSSYFIPKDVYQYKFDKDKFEGLLNPTVEINGVSESIDISGDTIDDVIKNINKNHKITAYAVGDHIRIEAKEGFDFKGIQGLTKEELHTVGQDAKITVNGDTITQSTNNFTMFGINYNLQSTGEVTLNVETNVDSVMEKVKEFVKEYNALIDVLNGLLKEKTHKGYTPLLQEEREAMKDKEIELWEAKAKSGLLNNDMSITRMLQNMRSGLYENVYENDGKILSGFNHITQIGITTGNYQSGGKLEIDEAKLRQAVIDNSDGVVNLLFKKSDIANVTDSEGRVIKAQADKRRTSSGLIDRLFDDMISGMKDIVRRSGTGDNANLYRSVQSNMLIDFVTSGSISLLDKDLTSVGSRITREESLLVSKETRYWNQFTAMEKAMQKMNSQSSWLSAQMGM